jgi:hypothetical protein
MLARLALLFFLGGVTIRPYVPPQLDPEPEFLPSDVHVVEILPAPNEWDANVMARPSFVAPLAGHVLRGARIGVRGEIKVPNARFCASKTYYALDPFGWICSSETRPTTATATTAPVLQLQPNSPLPYRYAMVLVEEGSYLPMWGSLQQLHEHAEPERQLGRGDTIALTAQLEQFEGQNYYITVDDKVVPTRSTHIVENYSQWQGVEITPETHMPFAWVNPPKAPIFDAPDGKKIEDSPQRTRLDILEEQLVGKNKWLRVGEGRWIRDKHVNEVRKIERPTGTGTNLQWFDVDLGEQVVVAYKNDLPVYATLTSTGRSPNNTPRGNYPIWGKVTAITMKSQEYDDIPYYVNRVPWVMFFQAHNALHGAYWHDRFGQTKSHGCVNLAPRDAKYLFEWLAPNLPPGWTSVRYWDLSQSPVAHVHDTHKAKDIQQERNIGPPDKSDEADRVEAAIARRDAAAAAAGLATNSAPAPGSVQPSATGLAVAPVQPTPIAPLPASVTPQ